ncbi:hypothetical protein AA0120_g2739 [Alternaria tenuissima]|nr:hypothetical protein AA0120_g2739 [Alternaria tenuissima]RYO64377.1 hypothetical protein AA0116_g4026 [Alternaria tenuissima]
MQALPNELLAQIASHLESQPPSITKFNHEPSADLAFSYTEINTKPLKSLSLVSWRWRKVVLPILFRFTRIALDKEPQWVPMDARLVDSMQLQLSSLSNHEFMLYTKLRSKFKATTGEAFAPAMDDVLIQLFRIQDGDEFLKTTPSIVWLPHLSKDFNNFSRFVTGNKLKHHIKSVVLHTDKEYDLRHVSTAQEPLAREVTDIWNKVFDILEPTRVVAAAPPKTMAALLDSHVGTNDMWAFEMKMHYIELLRDQPPIENNQQEHRTNDAPLIHRRPWNHLGYNEGSSITAYSTYEFYLKVAPRILSLVLSRLGEDPALCRDLTSFSFIAVFPLSWTVSSIVKAVYEIPSISKVSLQLAPGPENDLLSNGSKRRKAQSSDLWSEWRTGYKVLAMMETLHDQARGEEEAVKEIVSKDCYSKQLAVEVAEVIDNNLKTTSTTWKSGGVGRWIKVRSEDEGH